MTVSAAYRANVEGKFKAALRQGVKLPVPSLATLNIKKADESELHRLDKMASTYLDVVEHYPSHVNGKHMHFHAAMKHHLDTFTFEEFQAFLDALPCSEKAGAKKGKNITKAMVRGGVDTVNKVTWDGFVEQVDNMPREVSSAQKDALLLEFRAADEELVSFRKESYKNDRESRIVAAISKRMSDEFGVQLRERFHELEIQKLSSPQGEEAQSSSSLLWNIVGKLWTGIKALGYCLTTLLGWGFDIVKYILSHPRTAKILGHIALRYKRALCREMSLKLALHAVSQEGVVKHGYDLFKLTWYNTVSSYFQSTKFDDAFSSIQNTITAGLSSMLSMVPVFSASVPVIGVLVSMFGDMMKETTRFAVEVSVYEADVAQSFAQVMELFDLRSCLDLRNAKMMEEQEAEMGEGEESSGGWLTGMTDFVTGTSTGTAKKKRRR